MKIHPFEKQLIWVTRLTTLSAVFASLFGALFMFYLGIENTIGAFVLQIGGEVAEDIALPKAERTVIMLMDSLDRFLIGMVLLFFSYGVYGLFIRPERSAKEMGLPDWMHVDHISQLKQTIAEVIIVVLFVLFLRVALETFHTGGQTATIAGVLRFLMLPIAILVLSAGLRLVRLYPKGGAPGAVTAPTEENAERRVP